MLPVENSPEKDLFTKETVRTLTTNVLSLLEAPVRGATYESWTQVQIEASLVTVMDLLNHKPLNENERKNNGI